MCFISRPAHSATTVCSLSAVASAASTKGASVLLGASQPRVTASVFASRTGPFQGLGKVNEKHSQEWTDVETKETSLLLLVMRYTQWLWKTSRRQIFERMQH